MRMLSSIVIAAAAVIATDSSAQVNQTKPVTPATGVVVTGKQKDDPTRMICRTSEVTGSRLSKVRVCRTQAEWAIVNANDRRDVERMQANRYKGNE